MQLHFHVHWKRQNQSLFLPDSLQNNPDPSWHHFAVVYHFLKMKSCDYYAQWYLLLLSVLSQWFVPLPSWEVRCKFDPISLHFEKASVPILFQLKPHLKNLCCEKQDKIHRSQQHVIGHWTLDVVVRCKFFIELSFIQAFIQVLNWTLTFVEIKNR